MKRLLRWIGIALGSLVGLCIVAYAVVYVLSERILRRTYEVPTVGLSIPTDPASIIEGRRLATVHGCFGGCHGKQAEGVVIFDEPMIGRVVAPNLTAAVRKYSDAELVGVIRNGVRPGGRSTMSDALGRVRGADRRRPGPHHCVSEVIASGHRSGPSVSLGPLGRVGVAVGKFKTVAQLIAETVPPPVATSEEAAYGRYLARTSCSPATGQASAAIPIPISPVQACGWWLLIPRNHSLSYCERAWRSGEENLHYGSQARDILSHFTDAEIAALYSYLHVTADVDNKLPPGSLIPGGPTTLSGCGFWFGISPVGGTVLWFVSLGFWSFIFFLGARSIALPRR